MNNTITEWKVSDLTEAKHLGAIELQSEDKEYHYFEVIETKERLVFGGFCNVGFIESGYMEKDTDFSTDENLQELLSDLETYYNDGKEYVSHIVCTERM
jgi:hypothetical protein